MNDDNTTYRLTESERRHVAEVNAQINALQTEIWQMEGRIRAHEREMGFMRRHLGFLMGHLATEHGLPIGSALNADMTVLVAREANNGVAS